MRLLLILTLVAGTAAAIANSAVGTGLAHTGSRPLLGKVRGHDHLCLWQIPEPPLGRPMKPSDHFQLLAPGKGNDPAGPVIARAVKAAWTPRRCGINVRFQVRSNLDRFRFYDATDGSIWFDLHSPRLTKQAWTLTVLALGR